MAHTIGQRGEMTAQATRADHRRQRDGLGGEAPLEILAAAQKINFGQAMVERPLDIVHHQHHARRGALIFGIIGGDESHHRAVLLEIDRDGFDQWDKRIIETLIHKFNGGPVGLNSLAVAVGEEAGTLEEVNEPYLIMEGYIRRTPQGRVATANAYKKLGLKAPTGAQNELFG